MILRKCHSHRGMLQSEGAGHTRVCRSAVARLQGSWFLHSHQLCGLLLFNGDSVGELSVCSFYGNAKAMIGFPLSKINNNIIEHKSRISNIWRLCLQLEDSYRLRWSDKHQTWLLATQWMGQLTSFPYYSGSCRVSGFCHNLYLSAIRLFVSRPASIKLIIIVTPL